jgi:hypothetical protein
MKYIITEDQNKILWFKRRITQQHPLMREIILEGFEYTDVCDFNYPRGDQDYLKDILSGSAGTFVYSFDELFNAGNETFNSLYNLSYRYMEENYGNTILDYFYSHIQDLCDEE